MRDNDELLSERWRGLMLVLAFLLAGGLVAGSLAPAIAREDGAQGRASSSRSDGKREAGKRNTVDPEIIGGRKVAQGKDSFMAFVLIQNAGETVQCGGSLIAPSFVLTAAHCVQDDQAEVLAPDAFTVAIGAANLNGVPSSRIRGVISVEQHPDWDPITFENDAAVLELDVEAPENIAVPIAMVAAGQTTFDGAGQTAEVAGWGITSSGFPASHLQQASVDIVADSTCQAAYPDPEQGFVASVMICAAAPGRDSCQGDSGGPLFVQEFVGYKHKKKKNKHGNTRKKRIAIYSPVQMGIVSWGVDCAAPGFPGVYTRLSDPGINDFVVQTAS